MIIEALKEEGRVNITYIVYPYTESLPDSPIMVIATSPCELQGKLLMRNWPNITPAVH